MEGLLWLLLFAAFFYVMMRFGCGAHMVHGHGDHQAHGTGAHEQAPAASAAIDPVCGMEVPAENGYTKTHEGRAYRFCSRRCLDQFEANPGQYAAHTGGAR